MKKLLLSIFLIVLFQNVHSQNYVDLANISYAISPNNSWMSGKDANLSVATFNAKLPFKKANGDVAIFGLNGSQFNISSSDKEIEYPHLYSTTILLGYSKILSSKMELLLMALPKLSSDLNDISKNDFQFGGIVLLKIKKSDKFKYKFGLYYNQECWGMFFTPIVGFDWQANEKLQAFGNLPINATIVYKLNDKISTGLFFQAPAGSFRLSSEFSAPEPNNSFEESYFNNAYIHKTTQELSLFLDYYITRNIVFNFKLGHSVGRSYRMFREDDKLDLKIAAFNFGEERMQINEDFSDGLLFEFNLIYRLHFADMK